MANFEAIRWNFSSCINLCFLKSELVPVHMLSDITEAPITVSPPKAAPQNLLFPFITGAVNVGALIIVNAIADAALAGVAESTPTPLRIFLKE